MDTAFVKLVEDNRREVREQRILLQSRGQDAFGDDEQPSVARELAIKSDVPSDFAPDRPTALFGNAPGDGTRGHSPRLQKNDRAGLNKRRRNARRLAGTRRGGNHDRATAYQAIAHVADVRVDGQRLEGQ